MIKIGKLFFLFYLMAFTAAHSETIEISQSLSAKNLEVGDQLVLEVAITSNESMPQLTEGFNAPQIEGLDFMGVGESQSTSISIINLKKEAKYTKTLKITFACMKEGDYTLPPIDLKFKNYKTKPEAFKVFRVLPDAIKQKRQAETNNSMGNILDQFFGGFGGRDNDTQTANLDFFSEVEVDKSEVYEGEQFIATWYIYVSEGANLQSFDTLKFPTLKGFWKEDVDFASRFYWKPVVKDGKRYSRALLASYALTPYNSGKHLVDPFDLRTVISSGFFRAKSKVFNKKSNTIEINVLPLPEPKPATFYGGVGNFILDSRALEKMQILKGETYVFSFRVIGDQANTKFISQPKLELGEDFLLYNFEDEFRFIPQRRSSYKDFKFTIVPKKEGVFQIPDVKLSFLKTDVVPPEYYSVYAKLPVFKVLPNKNLTKSIDESFVEKNDLNKTQLTFRPIKNRMFIRLAYYSPGLWVSCLIWFISLILMTLMFRSLSKVKTQKETFLLDIEKRINNAKALSQKGESKKALEEIINIFSRLMGAVSGKRFGSEAEFSQAVEDLPASLKSKKEDLSSFNKKIQNLRFDTGLENTQKKVKLEECLQDFGDIYSTIKTYLKK